MTVSRCRRKSEDGGDSLLGELVNIGVRPENVVDSSDEQAFGVGKACQAAANGKETRTKGIRQVARKLGIVLRAQRIGVRPEASERLVMKRSKRSRRASVDVVQTSDQWNADDVALIRCFCQGERGAMTTSSMPMLLRQIRTSLP